MMNMKKTKGKRKIDIKYIEESTSRSVAFSKRRAGLFKKAAEICVLTGAKVGIIVASPAGRQAFAFRHPNSDFLFDHYQTYSNNDQTTTTTTMNAPPPLPLMDQLNQHYMEVSRELDAEKKRGVTIPPVSSGGSRWYDEAVDGLEVEELKEYLSSLEELKKKVLTRADELMIINNSSSVSFFASSNNNFQPVDNVSTNTGFEFEGGFHAGDGGNF